METTAGPLQKHKNTEVDELIGKVHNPAAGAHGRWGIAGSIFCVTKSEIENGSKRLRSNFSVFAGVFAPASVKTVLGTFPHLTWDHKRCMHARPHRRKDQLPLRSLCDLRSR